jgi:FAD/FMN-containing dehydrogenase
MRDWVDGLCVAGGWPSAGGIGVGTRSTEILLSYHLPYAGGLSFFSSQQGFICDNVLNCQVVLVSGEIVNANAEEHTDLWVGLRGAGNSLGIVTHFDLTIFGQGLLSRGTIYYFPQSFSSQIKAQVTELRKAVTSKDIHLMLSVRYSAMLNNNTFMCLN